MIDPERIDTQETTPHYQTALTTGRFYGGGYRNWIIYLSGINPRFKMPPINMPIHGNVRARIDSSRWIVDCPFCGSAQDPSRREPLFWCVECGMRQNDGAAITVVFPPDADRIEQVLMQRHNFKHRNWNPGETLQDLMIENKAHGE